MSQSRPLLSDLEVRYPFAPKSRRFFESVSVEETLASRDVIAQTEARLLGALGRVRYEPHMSEQIEFSSFFFSALVAGQDPVLASRFSKKEGERSKEYFVGEKASAKPAVISECFGVGVALLEEDGHRGYAMPFEGYLSLTSKYELVKNPKWKLVRQGLHKGVVHFSDNLLNDLFGDCAQAAIAEGVRNLRRASFPKQLQGVKLAVLRYVPTPRPRTNKGYLYVEDLLKHPAVTDGRHRLTWLVLSPWAANVKQLSDDEAVELIQGYVSAGGGVDSGMKRFIGYNVRRARRLGLMPPTLSKLRVEHPDLYALLPKEVLSSSPEEPRPNSAKSSR